jgi:hypothetical protein
MERISIKIFFNYAQNFSFVLIDKISYQNGHPQPMLTCIIKYNAIQNDLKCTYMALYTIESFVIPVPSVKKLSLLQYFSL